MKCKNCKEKMEYDKLVTTYSQCKLSIFKKENDVNADDSVKVYICPNCGAMCIKYMTWFD
jgi:hypothetical protein